jgi:hypothetical protein
MCIECRRGWREGKEKGRGRGRKERYPVPSPEALTAREPLLHLGKSRTRHDLPSRCVTLLGRPQVDGVDRLSSTKTTGRDLLDEKRGAGAVRVRRGGRVVEEGCALGDE